MPPVSRRDLTGLRVDLALTDPRTGESRWIDVSLVNTAGATVLAKETAAKLANPTSPTLPPAVSPSLLARANEKREKYSRLVMLASRQAARGRRISKPTFAPMIFSSVGDLAPDASCTLEWIVSKYRAKVAPLDPQAGRLLDQAAHIGLSWSPLSHGPVPPGCRTWQADCLRWRPEMRAGQAAANNLNVFSGGVCVLSA